MKNIRNMKTAYYASKKKQQHKIGGENNLQEHFMYVPINLFTT